VRWRWRLGFRGLGVRFRFKVAPINASVRYLYDIVLSKDSNRDSGDTKLLKKGRI
jgi:hypothetical protein